MSGDRFTWMLSARGQIGGGIVLAVLLLLGIWFFLGGSSPADASPSPTAPLPTESWPAVSLMPTFTPVPPSPTATVVPPTATPTLTPSPTPTPAPTPIIIDRAVFGQLDTVEYTIQVTVEGQRERSLIGLSLPPERILIAAVGNVEAGISLDTIAEEDIQIDGQRITMVLPRAQVTSVELLPGETIVYDVQRAWLLSEYEGLEFETLERARQEMERWAIERSGILEQAEAAAELQLRVLLRQLGFETIELTFAPTEGGSE